MARVLRLVPYAVAPGEAHGGARERLLSRITEGRRGPAFVDGFSYFARSGEMDWTPLVAEIDLKVLYQEPGSTARTVLVRMAPNLPFPPHPHGFIEDLFLVSGDAWVGEVAMRAGDYCRAPAGATHHDVRSGAAGSLAVVVSR